MNSKCNLNFSVLFALILFSINFSSAQNSLQQAAKHVSLNLEKYKLVEGDIEDWGVTNNYISKHNGVNHVYFQQTVNGIPVEGAIINVNVLKNGKILNGNSRFVSNVKQKAKVTRSISAEQALSTSLRELKIVAPRNLLVKERLKSARQEVVFSKMPTVDKDISVKLTYIENDNGDLKLTWISEIFSLEPQFNAWSVYVDASSGELIKKVNAVLDCTFEKPVSSCAEVHAEHKSLEKVEWPIEKRNSAYSGDSYLVFDSPLESPNHGERTLITDPADLQASPFGWHDTDGVAGAEHTITRGNNVYAQDDINGNNGTGFSPDGGAELHFDFTLDFNESPSTNTPAAQNLNSAITNLFYWNNIIHDVFYNYGFDEASGNFQQNNYGKGGIANDHVFADALDGSDIDNARFFTSPDGTNARMEMYLWNGGGSQTVFEVNTPGGIAGQYASVGAAFGASSYSVTGDLVIVDDGSANPTEGCGSLTNTAAIDGNIAVIDRGTCQFGVKALTAENAGAVAVIICNNVAGPPSNMTAGTDGGAVTIPVLMISQSDCATIRMDIPSVNVTITGTAGAAEIDGSYDNGIIAHEYGHGISTRLTGGAATNACLSNQEQGGEGWSDFFGLVLTHEAGDDRNTSRGIGTYAIGQSIFGGGIRTYPYTTDMAINPSTYDDVKTLSIPHGVGSVLCTMLWDLYWDLTDKYGYNSDLSVAGSGNAIAIQLVMDGLKLQPCSPGFTDVRDAILLADVVNNGGSNRCLIWNVFARRGLGVSADQGDTNDRSDGIEAYDVPSDLLVDDAILVTEAIEGEVVTIRSEATCGCSSKTAVEYKHTVPAGLTVISESIGSLVGNQVINTAASLAAEEKIIVEYTARVDVCNPFTVATLFEDDVETADKFASSTLQSSGNWVKTNSQFNSSSNSWYAEDFDVSSDYALTMASGIAISGSALLSFHHRFQTEDTWDGGVVEISSDAGGTWQVLDAEFIENGYRSAFADNASHALADLSAFTGSSDAQFLAGGFIRSVVDLSSFDGETIIIRFRFVTDTNTDGGGINGWYVDDIEITQGAPFALQADVESSTGIEDERSHLIKLSALDQEVVFVDKTTIGKKYGGDWSNAFSSVQDALQVAACNESVSEIWVKADTYYPTETSDQAISFNVSDGLSIFGGFTGGEVNLVDRDPLVNATILSGDIGVLGDVSDNSLHVIRGLDITSPALLDGIIIEGGNASSDNGGGLIIMNSIVNVRNCVIRNNNAADDGGGVHAGLSSAVNFTDCTFLENTCTSGDGRALGTAGEASVILEDCTIVDSNLGSGGSTIENAGSATVTSKGTVEITKNN